MYSISVVKTRMTFVHSLLLSLLQWQGCSVDALLGSRQWLHPGITAQEMRGLEGLGLPSVGCCCGYIDAASLPGSPTAYKNTSGVWNS